MEKSFCNLLFQAIVCSVIVLAGVSNEALAQSGYDYDDYNDDRRYYRDRDYRDDYDNRRDEQRQERRELDRERRRIERERRELEEERARSYEDTVSNNTTKTERCPSGFQPSENKCTPQERSQGCKDMRLPGGLGCVKR
jgi:hypothetical protein